MCALCDAAGQRSYSLSFGNFLEQMLGTPAKPATPSTPPSQHSVARDLRQVVEKAPSGKEALSALEGVGDMVADLEARAHDRALAEKALKGVAKTARANATARRFVLAYQPVKGGDVKTLEGVEYGDGGKVFVQSASDGSSMYPIVGASNSLASLRADALQARYYVAISYVDKVAD